MRHKLKLIIISVAFATALLISILLLLFLCTSFYSPSSRSRRKRAKSTKEFNFDSAADLEIIDGGGDEQRQQQQQLYREELICFQGADGLRIPDILDAPGEVIGKSSYGTLYKACLVRDIRNVNANLNDGDDPQEDEDEEEEEDGSGDGGVSIVVLLRFLRPACTLGMKEDVVSVVREIGLVRHPNLVPLQAFYMGPRGEKLLVHPFYARGNLAQFIRDRKGDAWTWNILHEISIGVVKGLCHLHTGLSKGIIHGNLSSKNILLGQNCQPYLSDYGLHLLLNPTAGQEMLVTSAGQGYKAPELIKTMDVNVATDVFSLGVILLELLTGKEPMNGNPSFSQEVYLPDTIRSAILDHRIEDLYHPDLLTHQYGHERMITKDRILKLIQLAITCCSPSPSSRPHTKEILIKLEKIGT
ncbi:hypothetical protein Dimus_000509 [Dionaea muscipula]